MISNWMDLQVSLYSTHNDNIGRPATYRDILLTEFAKDLPAIIALRKLDRSAPDYKLQAKPFKAILQAYTPAALLASKAKDNVIELSRTGLMQLDFDYDEIKDYDIRELMQCVFQLPFIAFCGLSCSGYGFYALALIAEPQRLAEYATHCFEILKSYGVNADESKGKKPENLRYLSYDANMLFRENPEPLQIKQFKTKPAIKKQSNTTSSTSFSSGGNAVLNAGLMQLQSVVSGNRWETVQKVAYTIGGLNNAKYLDEIKATIKSNTAFDGEEEKYLKCADVCFHAGAKVLFTR